MGDTANMADLQEVGQCLGRRLHPWTKKLPQGVANLSRALTKSEMPTILDCDERGAWYRAPLRVLKESEDRVRGPLRAPRRRVIEALMRFRVGAWTLPMRCQHVPRLELSSRYVLSVGVAHTVNRGQSHIDVERWAPLAELETDQMNALGCHALEMGEGTSEADLSKAGNHVVLQRSAHRIANRGRVHVGPVASKRLTPVAAPRGKLQGSVDADPKGHAYGVGEVVGRVVGVTHEAEPIGGFK